MEAARPLAPSRAQGLGKRNRHQSGRKPSESAASCTANHSSNRGTPNPGERELDEANLPVLLSCESVPWLLRCVAQSSRGVLLARCNFLRDSRLDARGCQKRYRRGLLPLQQLRWATPNDGAGSRSHRSEYKSRPPTRSFPPPSSLLHPLPPSHPPCQTLPLPISSWS